MEETERILEFLSMLSDKKPAEAAAPADTETKPAGSDKAAALASALPALLGALSGNGELLDGRRLNLMRALEPYLSDKRHESIERAIRMANMAKAAKDTLGILGR